MHTSQQVAQQLREKIGTCGVCDARTVLHYDGRFDTYVCDVCDAMLMIRDDEFRRAHPEHEDVIRAIWHERGDPENARSIGLRYYDIGYWDEQDDNDRNDLLAFDSGDESGDPGFWSNRAT